MGLNLFNQECGCSPPVKPDVPPAPFTPVDWMKCGCDALKNAMRCFSETDSWVVCSRDCEKIDFAVPIRLALGSTTGSQSSIYSTTLNDCQRTLLIRPEEWRNHPELGECPRRELYIYVECSKEWIELLPSDGLPLFEVGEGYSCYWRVNGKSVSPCFKWSPPRK